MKTLWLRIALSAALAVAMCLTLSCGCGDDDDDDDDDNGDGGSTPDPNCTVACEGLFDCGGQFWYEDIDECMEYCNEWSDTAVDCADCFFGCFEDDPTCIAASACLLVCAEGPCLDELEELDDYWAD